MQKFKLQIGNGAVVEITMADQPTFKDGYIHLQAGEHEGNAYQLKSEQCFEYFNWVQNNGTFPDRHPLFPNHDQIKVQIIGGGEAFIEAREYGSIHYNAAAPEGYNWILHCVSSPMIYITEACYNKFKAYLIDRNAILDLDEGDM